MKLVSWGIVFVLIVFSFSFAVRVILNNKMEIMKKEVEYNNALNEATVDATRELAKSLEYSYGIDKDSPEIILGAMEKFFDTFSLAFGYYGGNTKSSQVNMYVPALLTMTYDGYYIYHMNHVGNNFQHTLTPKSYYTTEVGGYLINLTLDNYIRLDHPITLTGISSNLYENPYKLGEKIIIGGQEIIRGDINKSYNSGTTVAGKSSIGEDDSDINMMAALVQKYKDYEADPIAYPRTNWDHSDFLDFANDQYADLTGDLYINDLDYYILEDYINSTAAGNKQVSEGRIVDLDVEGEINGANGLLQIPFNYEGQQAYYEKSFYYIDDTRYLLEEWYCPGEVVPDGSGGTVFNYDINGRDSKYIYRRLTQYTEEDVAFTKALEYVGAPGWLVRGNPENTGFIDPMTGQYSIGLFNAEKKEIITNRVTDVLQFYVREHNQYAQSLGITYDFVLPEVINTDWDNALNDITILAFVQRYSYIRATVL